MNNHIVGKHKNAMLSAPGYPAGVFPWKNGTIAIVDEWPTDDIYAPPSSVRMRARMARDIDVENFDGALVPRDVIRLVHDVHGGEYPLGWAKGDMEMISATGELAAPVYVFAGDFLVAIVAPLYGSPSVRRPS